MQFPLSFCPQLLGGPLVPNNGVCCVFLRTQPCAESYACFLTDSANHPGKFRGSVYSAPVSGERPEL